MNEEKLKWKNNWKPLSVYFLVFAMAMVSSFYLLKYINTPSEGVISASKPNIIKVSTDEILEIEQSSVVVFATSWCPVCKKLKKYLEVNDVSYKLIDIELSEENMAKFQSIGGSAVPLIVTDGKIIEGFNEKYAKEIFNE